MRRVSSDTESVHNVKTQTTESSGGGGGSSCTGGRPAIARPLGLWIGLEIGLGIGLGLEV